MDILGKPPINAFAYYTGKSSMFLPWLAAMAQVLGYNLRFLEVPYPLLIISFALAIFGALISVVGILNLGTSLRVGLPKEKTSFKKNGLYQFSRNPIYLGLIFITLASIIYTINPLVLVLGIYGVFSQHLIILSEEKFLRKRFGSEYAAYSKKVRRYI